MHRGYIKLWRKLSDSQAWTSEPFTRGQAMIDLVLLANHKPGHVRKRGIRVDLERGDIGWSQRELSKRWKWSRGKTLRFLSEMCSGNDPFLVPQTGPQNKNVTALYKIVNYERYQSDGTTNDTTDGPQTGHRRATDGTRTRMTKNEKNENISPYSPPPGGPVQYSKSFDEWWSLYPKKVGKDAAFRSWKKVGKANGVTVEKLMAAINEQIKAGHFKGNDGCDYIPNPATWLNQGRWNDEIKTCTKKEWIA